MTTLDFIFKEISSNMRPKIYDFPDSDPILCDVRGLLGRWRRDRPMIADPARVSGPTNSVGLIRQSPSIRGQFSLSARQYSAWRKPLTKLEEVTATHDRMRAISFRLRGIG